MLKKLAVFALAASLVTPALADNWLGKAQAINKQAIGKRDSAARQVFKRVGSTRQNRKPHRELTRWQILWLYGGLRLRMQTKLNWNW
ncbi:Uncharacterised protein [Kingella kingae]|uniref:hypothetical protein n=1 Tax=Kingella kingae TaxID=504 RepID=UPI000E002F15|nr:hypothetical protein [Kingella kingae]STR03772.1 Uncharacterised protein [Kingella kingae]